MHMTLEKLLQGDKEIAAYYEKARAKWNEFFEANRDSPVSEWANWLFSQQIVFFERECGGRWLGQEVMAWSGFGTLYSCDVGFDENLEGVMYFGD